MKLKTKDSYSAKLLKGTTIVITFTIFSSILGYILKFILARNLEVNDIGLFYTVYGFVMFFVFLRDLGSSETLVYFIPRYLIENSKNKIKSLIILTLLIQISVGLILSSIFYVFSDLLVIYYFKNSMAKTLLLAFSIYFILDGLSETLYGVFQGYQIMLFNQGIEFVFQLFSFVLFIIFIYLGLTVSSFGFIYIISSIITAVIFYFLFFKKVFPNFFEIKSIISKNFIKHTLKFSLPTMTGGIAMLVFSQQSIFFLTYFVGLESVGYYVMAMSLAKFSNFFVNATKQVFSPMISQLWKNKNIHELNNLFNRILIYAYSISIPISLILIFFSDEILTLIFTNKFLPANQILKFQSIYMLFFTLTLLFRMLFLNMGFPKKARNIVYVALFFNLFFNILLVPKFGLIGVGVADVVSVILSFLYSMYLVKKNLPIKIKLNDFFKILVSSFLFTLSIVFFKKIFSLNFITELIIVNFISGSIYLGSLFIFKIFNIDEIIKMNKLFFTKK
ncbi:flippase [Candidatus Woesearchaeota archaeon]|jgi:O-antigen/teichoic acid export membrane protein|nr:flippase [Candidatus Woesearchaeota archaeon]